MDRAFLSYYEAELGHIRDLAREFAALHPAVARNLSLETMPCPDPYVERLLEGVAWLAARTRMKLDAEGARAVRGVLEALYPDLALPAPAVSSVVLHPGPQVQALPAGHLVRRGTRLGAALREGMATRATYTTVQEVTLWPIRVDAVDYMPDRGALARAGLARQGAEAALRLTVAREGPGALSALALDRLDLSFGAHAQGGAIFDAIFGATLDDGRATLARPTTADSAWRPAAAPAMIGIADDEGLLPRLRPAFEGYRLLRDYFLMPDRYHSLRLAGLAPAVRACGEGAGLQVAILLSRPAPVLAGLAARDLRLFSTPVVNLFEAECDPVEIDPRAGAHPVHADRTRPLDHEIYALLRVEDADRDGPEAAIRPLHDLGTRAGAGLVYTTERRPRRPVTEELRRGQTRTSHAGEDLWIALHRPAGVPEGPPLRLLDIRALCTNRDLPILDDTPNLTLETGDPVARVELLGAMRRPRPALPAPPPAAPSGGEADADALTWRLVAQLSLDHLSLAEAGADAAPLRALLDLYADRGDPAHARHARAIARVASRPVVERLAIPGPLCFGRGVEITLDIDEGPVAGASALLLPALLARLFARHAAVNSFVRTRARRPDRQEEVAWPMTPGLRAPI